MSLDNKPANEELSCTTISNTLVFSDLDGTLLDHATYSYDPASDALKLLRRKSIPLVLASSKTAAEILPLRAEIGFEHCEAIVENGAGILERGEVTADKDESYQHILCILEKIPSALRTQFIGFSNWTVQEVSERTGLSFVQAGCAKQRQFSEPGEWLGNDASLREFSEALYECGLTIQRGGRYYSISFGTTKADQMSKIKARYERPDQKIFMVALGDGENDIAMLKQADLGVIILNPSHSGIQTLEGENSGHIVRASAAGPEGWNQEILKLFK